MEVMTTIGFAASIVQTIDVVARVINNLHKLQARWKVIDLTITQLIGHLGILRTALTQISSWVPDIGGKSPRNRQLTMDLETSIKSCHNLVSFMEDFLSSLDWTEATGLNFESKAKALLKDSRVKDCQSYLSHQSIALNLLLTVLNW